MTFPEKGQVQTVAKSAEGEAAEIRVEQPRNNSAAWGRVLVPPQGSHAVSLSSCANTEAPTRWERLMVLPTGTDIPDRLESEG